MTITKQEIEKNLLSNFFGFRVKKRKFTFLIGFLIIGIGIYSAFIIPKESSPEIDFGIIQITTIYQGVNPEDIDTLITQKIEQEIKDIEGINKMNSTSSVGIATTTLELTNEADPSKVLVEVKDAVDKTNLPSDAEDPIVTEISADNEAMFNALIYANSEQYPISYLKNKATELKGELEGKGNINRIDIEWSEDYDIIVEVQRARIESLGVSISDIADAIRTNNRNQPLGSHIIEETKYDFRIQWEISDIQKLWRTIIPVNNQVIFLEDIAVIYTEYDDERIARLGKYGEKNYNYVTLTFNKKAGDNIFQSADQAKKLLEKTLEKQEYEGLYLTYTQDIADVIREDYQSLASNGLQTIILVFLAILLFVGFKESLIASITIPLAFLITFMVLLQLDLSLNFLTNFSLIICFGIAIDTTIVIIEWAHEKLKAWFSPQNAVLLAVREYKRPLISGTATTCIVFLPLLSLPGITGKFLAYIPITIFTTLIAALFISLTINSALYYKLSKPKKTYEKLPDEDNMLQEDEKILLASDRQGKTEKTEAASKREKALDALSSKYSIWLGKVMKNNKSRFLAILLPLGALVLSFIILSPILGFEFFPSGDSPYITTTIQGKPGQSKERLIPYTEIIDSVASSIPEVKAYYYTILDNTITLNIELFEKSDRKRSSFEIEEELTQKLQILQSKGLEVSIQVQAGWPPSVKPVGIKLIANTNQDFRTLQEVATEFENYLISLEWTKNVSNSSEQTPGQFVFTLNKEKLGILGLLPSDISIPLYQIINGTNAGTIKDAYNNQDIQVMYQDFQTGVSPSIIQSIRIPTRAGNILMWSISDYYVDNSISQISRQDTNITIRVESDTEQNITPDVLQAKLMEFASTYEFPAGITYQAGGETQENADIIQATGIAFIIAIILIYTILVLQFNSFLQPTIIMYSIIMWLLGTNIWLWITGNPYSMAFGIWFIALTGIVVNDAIVFIDRANQNTARGMNTYNAIVETGKSRLQPIILTTITTVVGLSSVARQDEFFAGLAYTIMFGLTTASAMTLFVIPALYYDKDKLVYAIKRGLLPLILFLMWPLAIFLSIQIVMLVINIQNTQITNSIFMIVTGMYTIIYLIHTIREHTRTGQNRIQKILGFKVVNNDDTRMSTRQAIKRLSIKYTILLIPTLILSSIIHPWLGALYIVIILLISMYRMRIREDNQMLHGKLTKTKVVEMDT
jgi:multidrug efflux pump